MVSLLQMSFSGAVFIAAIAMIRAITMNRLPKKTFLILWELALLRLMIPLSVPSMFSVHTLISNKISRFSGTESGVMRAIQLQNQFSAQTTGQLSTGSQPPVSLQFVVWCVGMTLLAAFFAISYLRCLREFQTALPIRSPYAEKWLKEHLRKRSVFIRQSDRISTPLTYGIFQPVILMPKTTDWDDVSELRYILTHEYVHIYHFDTVKKLIMTAALCIHWFNPFVWGMYVLFNRDMELACDESVIRTLGETSRSAYSLMLINMEAKKSGLLPLCSNFSKNATEERITAIMKTKKTTIFSLVSAYLIVAGTATAFATSAQSESAYQEEDLLSYANTQDGKTYYSLDGGKSFEPLTDEEFERRFKVPDVEWWTYEEYKIWLENEKKQLQSMIGERCWTGGRGDFIWTQEIVDETIARYEEILQDIKNGMKVSKSVDGDIQMAYNPQDLLSTAAPFCAEQVKLGNMEQSEADEILNRYTNQPEYE